MKFELLNFQVERRPNFKYAPYTHWRNLMNNSFFEKAIINASPDLYFIGSNKEVRSKEQEDKINKSVFKYWSRATNRPTPYGMFSGVNSGKLSLSNENNEIRRVDPLNSKYSVKLDGALLLGFYEWFNNIGGLRRYLTYTLNSSISVQDGRGKYIDFAVKPDKIEFKLSKFANDEFLQHFFSKKSLITYSFFRTEIETLDNEIEEEEIWDFFNSLIDSKILIWDIWPTGIISQFKEEMVLMQTLNNIPPDNLRSLGPEFHFAYDSFRQLISFDFINSSAEAFKEIIDLLDKTPLTFKEKAIFQIHTSFDSAELKLKNNDVKNIEAGISILAALNANKKNASLNDFIQKFTDKYQDEEVKLLDVLDPVHGIGYPPSENFSFSTPNIVKDILPVNVKRDSPVLSALVKRIIDGKLVSTIKSNKKVLEIDETELKELEDNFNKLPFTFNTTVSIYETGHDREIFLKDVSGPSASKIIGRYTGISSDIRNYFEQIKDLEKNYYKDFLMAEISFLPQPRILNVVDRLDNFDAEISLIKDSKNTNKKISLDDLFVRVERGNVYLRSLSLGKFILPTFSNVYNYGSHSLGILKFLGDLHAQGTINYSTWDWAEYDQLEFTPAVKHRNVLLTRAAINIRYLAETFDTFKAKVKDKISEYNFHNTVQFGIMDNELTVDLSFDLSFELMYDHFKKFKSIRIFECPYHIEVKSEQEIVPNEHILFWRNIKKNSLRVPNQRLGQNIQRKFLPFDNWVYLKIYADYPTLDKVLGKSLLQITKKLRKRNVLKNFHFVRYFDTASHLRLRFEIDFNENFGIKDFISLINSINEHDDLSRHLFKIEYSTFERELERYVDLPFTEKLFTIDSYLALQVINSERYSDEEEGRLLAAIVLSYNYLALFKLDLNEKISLLEAIDLSFRKENNLINKNGSRNLSRKYESFEVKLHELLASDKPQVSIHRIVKIQSAYFAKKFNVQQIENSKWNLGDYLHMLCNRLFVNHNRTYEVIVYNFLFRHYKKEKAMLKKV